MIDRKEEIVFLVNLSRIFFRSTRKGSDSFCINETNYVHGFNPTSTKCSYENEHALHEAVAKQIGNEKLRT